MFRASLDAVDEKPDFDPALHEQFMQAVQATPASQMSLTEKFRAANYLQLAVLWLAGENGWKIAKSLPDGKGGHVSEDIVDESMLPAEMAALHKIQDTPGYSPALGAWIDAQRADVAARLIGDESFGRRLFEWPRMDAEDKRQLLQDIVALNMNSYSREGIAITVPPVVFDDEIKSAAAVNDTALFDEGGKAVPVTKAIRVGAGLRDADNPFLAVVLTYHESIHALITQLAAMRVRGSLPESHPLHDDASTALAERLFGRALPMIRSVYDNDFEEKFVFGCQNRFGDSLIASPA
jgi:hypothetical protein